MSAVDTHPSDWLTGRRAELPARFDEAAARVGRESDSIELAGALVRLEWAGGALRERLAPAFSHLRVTRNASADLTLQLWDSHSTGTGWPEVPAVEADSAVGALYYFDEPPVRASFQPGLETLSVLDSGARRGWHWVGNAETQPYWEQACPIRQLLFWSLGERGYLQVHGGAVGTPDAGVLLVGKAGSGKSTSALSCLGTDLLYAGDDYVAVAVEPEPRVQSLYASGKLEPDHVGQLLPHLLPLLANRDRLGEEKAVLYVDRHFPAQTTHGFPLAAILVPAVRRGQRESRVVKTTRAAAFAALAPSTMVQLHTADSRAWATMSKLIERVPCYGFELGSDISGIPRAIDSFLAGLEGPST